MKDAGIADGPQGEGREREEKADAGDAGNAGTDGRIGGGNGIGPGIPPGMKHGGSERDGNEDAIWPEKRSEGYGKGESECGGPAGMQPEARGGPEGERDGEERRPLGERACGIDGGKGAEDGEPERGVRGAVLEGCRRDEASEIGEKKTGSEIESDLKKNGGSVVLHAEELEAEGEEKRIAGEADEGGKCFAVRKGERVPAAEEKILAMLP